MTKQHRVVDSRTRISLAGLADHERYIVRREAGGLIILEPAVVVPRTDVPGYVGKTQVQQRGPSIETPGSAALDLLPRPEGLNDRLKGPLALLVLSMPSDPRMGRAEVALSPANLRELSRQAHALANQLEES